MPIYEYQGQEYDIDTDDQSVAKTKILAHINKQKPEASAWESVQEGAVRGLGQLKTGLDFSAAGLAKLFGDEKAASDILDEISKREKTISEQAPSAYSRESIKSKLARVPGQIAPYLISAPLAIKGGAEQVYKTLLEEGMSPEEARNAAVRSGAIDVAGLVIPGGLGKNKIVGGTTGALIGGGMQEVARQSENISRRKEGLKEREFNLEDLLVGAGVGGAFGVKEGARGQKQTKLQKIMQERKAQELAKLQQDLSAWKANSAAFDPNLPVQESGIPYQKPSPELSLLPEDSYEAPRNADVGGIEYSSRDLALLTDTPPQQQIDAGIPFPNKLPYDTGLLSLVPKEERPQYLLPDRSLPFLKDELALGGEGYASAGSQSDGLQFIRPELESSPFRDLYELDKTTSLGAAPTRGEAQTISEMVSPEYGLSELQQSRRDYDTSLGYREVEEALEFPPRQTKIDFSQPDSLPFERGLNAPEGPPVQQKLGMPQETGVQRQLFSPRKQGGATNVDFLTGGLASKIQELVDFGYSRKDAEQLIRSQTIEQSRLENNASGESSASLEALSRLSSEVANDQGRYVIKQSGEIVPLVSADRVDYRPAAGEVVVQRGIGADEYTVLDSSGVQNLKGVVNRARPALDALRRKQGGALNLGAFFGRPKKEPKQVSEEFQRLYGPMDETVDVATMLRQAKDSPEGFQDLKTGLTAGLSTPSARVRKSDNPVLQQIWNQFKQRTIAGKAESRKLVRETAPTYFEMSGKQQADLMNKVSPLFNRKGLVVDSTALRELGLTDKEASAYNELRTALDTMQDHQFESVGKMRFDEETYARLSALRAENPGKVYSSEDGLTKQEAEFLNQYTRGENYFPRIREGAYRVSVIGPNGLEGYYGAESKAQVRALERRFEKEGKQVKSENIYETRLGDTDTSWYDPTRDPEVLMRAHTKEAENVRGFVGDETPEDMNRALAKYFDRFHNTQVALKLENDILKPMRNEGMANTKMYKFMEAKALQETGREWMLTAQPIREVVQNLRNVGIPVNELTSMLNTAFYSMKVLPAPVQYFNAVTGALMFGLPRAFKMANLGVDVDKAKFVKDFGEALFKGAVDQETRVKNRLRREEGLLPTIHDESFFGMYGQKHGNIPESVKRVMNRGDIMRTGNFENWIRSAMYDSIVKQLSRSKVYDIPGKVLTPSQKKQALDVAASRITGEVMADFSPAESSHVAASLGPVGRLGTTLTSYSRHSWSNLTEFLKDAKISDPKTLAPFAILGAGAMLASGTEGISETLMMPQLAKMFNKLLKATGIVDKDVIPDLQKKHNKWYAEADDKFLASALLKGLPSALTESDVHRSFALANPMEAAGSLGSIAQYALGGTERAGVAPPIGFASDVVSSASKLANKDLMTEAERRKAIQTVLPRVATPWTSEISEAAGGEKASKMFNKEGYVSELRDRPNTLQRFVASGAKSLEERGLEASEEARAEVRKDVATFKTETEKLATLVLAKAPESEIQKRVEVLRALYEKIASTGEDPGDFGSALEAAIERQYLKQNVPADQRAIVQEHIGQGMQSMGMKQQLYK